MRVSRSTRIAVYVTRTHGDVAGVSRQLLLLCRSLLANLFLHYVFDVWVTRTLPSVRFCRYADDAVIHCQSEKQAQLSLIHI